MVNKSNTQLYLTYRFKLIKVVLLIIIEFLFNIHIENRFVLKKMEINIWGDKIIIFKIQYIASMTSLKRAKLLRVGVAVCGALNFCIA